MKTILFIYLCTQLVVTLAVCLLGGGEGIMMGIPLYGVPQTLLLLLALKTEIWNIWPAIRRWDVGIASVALLVFLITLVQNVLDRFPGGVFTTGAPRVEDTALHWWANGLAGTMVYTLISLPILIGILWRACRRGKHAGGGNADEINR